MGKKYNWDPDKNRLLQKERSLNFELIVATLENGQLLGISPHHNVEFKHQKIMFIALNDHVVAVLCVENKTEIFLKTAFYDCKAKAHYFPKNN